MTTFFISDTHFSHANIIKFQPDTRPFDTIEEHNEELVKRWNETVSPKDTVWHLGDVFFPLHGVQYLERLNGVKHLVMGNHDVKRLKHLQPYFNRICGCAEYKGMVLTHIPVHVDQLDERYKGEKGRFTHNVHGHLHGYCLDDERYINVCCDFTDLKPVAFEELI